MKQAPHSYTALKNFRTCPRKYFYETLTRQYARPFVRGSKQDHGDKVHKAVENAWLFREDFLPPGFEEYQWMLEQRHEFERFLKRTSPDGEFDCAAELWTGIRRNGSSCTYKDGDCYFRGKLDFVAWCGDTGVIDDTKTGNPKYGEINQIETQALMFMRNHPEVNRVMAQLTWTQKPNDPTRVRVYRSQDLVPPGVNDYSLMQTIQDNLFFELGRMDRLIASGDPSAFPPVPGFLCAKYCAVPNNHCTHSGAEPDA